MPGAPSIDLCLTNCLLNHGQCQQILTIRAPAVQAYLQCPIDSRAAVGGAAGRPAPLRGGGCTAPWSGGPPTAWLPRGGRIHGRPRPRRPAAPPSCVCRCACRPHPSPDQPRHLSRTITSACPPRADQVVCHGLSRSLADSLARVQTWIDAGEADQRTSLIWKRSMGANVGATRANDLPRQRTNADRRPRTLPVRGPIRTTLNVIQVTTGQMIRRTSQRGWLALCVSAA